jgi:hypothetical protein
MLRHRHAFEFSVDLYWRRLLPEKIHPDTESAAWIVLGRSARISIGSILLDPEISVWDNLRNNEEEGGTSGLITAPKVCHGVCRCVYIHWIIHGIIHKHEGERCDATKKQKDISPVHRRSIETLRLAIVDGSAY